MVPNCKRKTENEEFLDKYYPIGSVYINVTPVNPNEIWGGVWERIEDVFLIGCSETYKAGVVGGSKTHNHKYKVASYITKLVTVSARAVDYATNTMPTATKIKDNQAYNTNSKLGDGSAWNYGDMATYVSEGNTETVSNMPPYLPVYMWKRVS